MRPEPYSAETQNSRGESRSGPVGQGTHTADGGVVAVSAGVALTNPNTYAATHAAVARASQRPGLNSRLWLMVGTMSSLMCADLGRVPRWSEQGPKSGLKAP